MEEALKIDWHFVFNFSITNYTLNLTIILSRESN